MDYKQKTKTELLEIIEYQEKQITSVQSVTNAVRGKLDIQEVLDLITTTLVKDIGVAMSVVYLWSELDEVLSIKSIGMPKIAQSLFDQVSGDSIATIMLNTKTGADNFFIKAIKEGRILESEQMYDFARPVFGKTASGLLQKVINLDRVVGIPLVVRKEKLGVLGVSWGARAVRNIDREVLQTFANQISIAIYNARLFSQVQTQVKELDARTSDLESLLALSETAIQKLESQDVVEKIIDEVPENFEHLSYKIAVFLNYDEENQSLSIASISKKVRDVVQKNFKEDLTQIKIQTRETKETLFTKMKSTNFITLDELSEFTNTRARKKATQVVQKMLGIKSVLVRKVEYQEKFQGILIIGTGHPKDALTSRDEEVSGTIANNLSLAYENAKLYQQIKDQLAKVERANRELRQLDEAKTNFVSIASHQLRTPISGVKGYLSMLKEGDFGDVNEKQQEIIGLNLSNIERLVKLVDIFLDVTKIESGKLVLEKSECDLTEVIDSVVEELKSHADAKDIELTFIKPQKKSNIMCDTERIRHVFVNLIDNSIKYTPKGSVKVELEVLDGTELITVEDTGIGIGKDEIAKLFDKFVRAKGGVKMDANGSGLGLYIVKKIVEGHRGKVWAESRGEGQGAKFFVELSKDKELELETPKKVNEG